MAYKLLLLLMFVVILGHSQIHDDAVEEVSGYDVAGLVEVADSEIKPIGKASKSLKSAGKAVKPGKAPKPAKTGKAQTKKPAAKGKVQKPAKAAKAGGPHKKAATTPVVSKASAAQTKKPAGKGKVQKPAKAAKAGGTPKKTATKPVAAKAANAKAAAKAGKPAAVNKKVAAPKKTDKAPTATKAAKAEKAPAPKKEAGKVEKLKGKNPSAKEASPPPSKSLSAAKSQQSKNVADAKSADSQAPDHQVTEAQRAGKDKADELLGKEAPVGREVKTSAPIPKGGQRERISKGNVGAELVFANTKQSGEAKEKRLKELKATNAKIEELRSKKLGVIKALKGIKKINDNVAAMQADIKSGTGDPDTLEGMVGESKYQAQRAKDLRSQLGNIALSNLPGRAGKFFNHRARQNLIDKNFDTTMKYGNELYQKDALQLHTDLEEINKMKKEGTWTN